METSPKKQLPVCNISCTLLSEAVNSVDKFQQTCQAETYLVREVSLVVTNDTSYQKNFQIEISRPRYNEAGHLISALNIHVQRLEKELDERQVIIETLLQNIQNYS